MKIVLYYPCGLGVLVKKNPYLHALTLVLCGVCSPLLWASLVVFLLLNVSGWRTLFWVSIIPLIIILAVGTKLQAIITTMALEIQERHAVVQGIPLVKVSDKHFWFNRPQLVLYLIHFVMFQNAFQITYFLWIWYEFGLKSCFHENFTLIIIRVSMGVGVQFLCSYITLPLYALVTQMGSTMKKSVFDEQTSKAIKKWRMAAMKKKHEKRTGHSPTRSVGSGPSASPVQSPPHPLQRFKTTGHSTRSSTYSMRNSEDDMSDNEADAPSPTSVTENPPLMANVGRQSRTREYPRHEYDDGQKHDEDDFSFAKPDLLTGP
uniref:MLO-like protein n=1 Tax=Nelumbo nucifera TaxID=4432 RepID=A0A822ZPW5_NELNU|nr:TPA_asm: hypothetical protein HUJ06_016457 [Nelumbo nucifera]